MERVVINNPAVGIDLEQLQNQFNNEWWDGFLTKTKNMTIPAILPTSLSREQTRILRRYILDILAEVGCVHKEKYGYRLWIDGEQVLDLEDHFSLHPRPDEDAEEWVSRAFGEKKFGVILNRGEKFSEELSQATALMLEPILREIGMPTEGILYTIFVGNYDMTPLGIHRDFAGKSVLHFHLGPGPKTMYVWEDDDYKTGPEENRFNNMNIEKHLPHATKHTFGEGEFYFMPENKYHLGMQNELSIGIACWFFNRCDYDFANQLLERFRSNYLKNSRVMLKPDKKPVDDISTVEPILSLFDLPGGGDVGIKSLLGSIYKDFRYSLFSNAGFRNRPIPRSKDVDIKRGDRVYADLPYKIVCREAEELGHFDLFVRGTKVTLRNFQGLEQIVDRINNQKMVDVNQLVEAMDDPLAEQKVCYLLKMLHKHRGISLV